MSKGSGVYVVKLENSKAPPKLITKVKPLGGKKYLLSLIHPNTRLPIIEKEQDCDSISDAISKANALRETPEAKEAKTWFEETLFIPQPKRGKMKLKTKKSVEEEMNLERDTQEAKEPKVAKNIKKTATPKKVNKVKAQKVAKKSKKNDKKKKSGKKKK